MRVVEPNKFRNSEVQKNTKKRNRKILFLSPVVLLFIVLIIFVGSKRAESPELDSQSEPEVNSLVEVIPEDSTQSGLRQFSGNEFRLLFDNTTMPNLTKVNVPPSITGNDIADTRIRQIAELRGYKLRSSPIKELTFVDGYPLQTEVHQDWLDLKAAATASGLKMSIVSAFRSVDDQRSLFVSRLQAEGVTISEIVAGNADKEIDAVLVTTAVPGYSKHHTGYTVDLFCAGYIFENFKNSTCNTWLSANNFEQAKTYGFIPSYPPDADLQGPDPEAWEYVYVGKDVLNY